MQLIRTLISESTNPILDWRNKDGKNWVTPVKNQGGCGSCWAFSTIGTIEAVINIESGNPDLNIDLSEQHLVSDCYTFGDCDGGYLLNVFRYITNTGVPEEICFPYTARNCMCEPCIGWQNDVVRIAGYGYTENGISKWALETYGPCSIILHISAADWSYYTGGIYEPTREPGGWHAVVLVGYNDIEEYWIIKNSWGTNWGENGYMKIRYDTVEIWKNVFVVTDVGDVIPPNINSVTINSSDAYPGDPVIVTVNTTDASGISNVVINTDVSGSTILIDQGSDTWQGTITAPSTAGTYTVTVVATDASLNKNTATDASSTFTSRGKFPGDVTGDGKVNICDAVLLFNWVSYQNERGTTYILR
jgi:hypothetical protein